MAEIFISYKNEERDRILPLARALESLGYTVWWDLQLVPGDAWKRRIKTELDAARCVIVTWTRHTIGENGLYTSDWIDREAEEGYRRQILIPVQLDRDQVAWEHKHVQYANLIDWRGQKTHHGFITLAEGVKRLVGDRAKPEDPEVAEWAKAEVSASAERYAEFVARFPNSRFVKQANERIAEITEALARKSFLSSLVVANRARLARADYEASA